MSVSPRPAEREDFDGLYRRHSRSVYRYSYAVLGNHADAEDVTQQTFLNAYRACERGTKPRKAENWLIRIAHNEVRRHLRDSRRHARTVELDDKVALPHAERSDPSLAEVMRGLRRLPASQRAALVMREFEGRSFAEIAEVLGMSRGALESHTFRARRALAEELEDALTCDQAEEALLSPTEGRLPRRVMRRLKEHLEDCRSCVTLAKRHRRRPALLRSLSVLPIPGSLLLVRAKEAAASAFGQLAAGGAGVGTGLAAKATAFTAAAAVTAGGAGYGIANRAEPEPAGAVGPAQAEAPVASRPGREVAVRLAVRRPSERIERVARPPAAKAQIRKPAKVEARPNGLTSKSNVATPASSAQHVRAPKHNGHGRSKPSRPHPVSPGRVKSIPKVKTPPAAPAAAKKAEKPTVQKATPARANPHGPTQKAKAAAHTPPVPAPATHPTDKAKGPS
jgi:RNA polymerase sigma factor (sigma-70 family)